jgi:DNA modification methylase
MNIVDKVVNCDSLIVMENLQKKCVKLLLASPPYNIGIEYDNYNDKRYWVDFIDWNRKALVQAKRIAEHVVWVIGSHNNMEFFTKLRPVLEEMKPYKVIHAPRYLYMNPVEFCIYLWDEGHSWKRIHKPPMLLQGQVPHWMPVKFGKVENLFEGHPATFPERYPAFFIESFTEPGDIVMDCFGGSGTTAVVAQSMGRHYISIDVSQEYCDIAEKRLAASKLGVPFKDYKKGNHVQEKLF